MVQHAGWILPQSCGLGPAASSSGPLSPGQPPLPLPPLRSAPGARSLPSPVTLPAWLPFPPLHDAPSPPPPPALSLKSTHIGGVIPPPPRVSTDRLWDGWDCFQTEILWGLMGCSVWGVEVPGRAREANSRRPSVDDTLCRGPACSYRRGVPESGQCEDPCPPLLHALCCPHLPTNWTCVGVPRLPSW